MFKVNNKETRATPLTVLYPDTNIKCNRKRLQFCLFCARYYDDSWKIGLEAKTKKLKTASFCYTNLCHNESKSSKQRPIKIFPDHCPKSFTLRTSSIRRKLQIWSHLLKKKKCLIENFIFFFAVSMGTWTLTSKQYKTLPATNERNMEKQ